MHFLILIIFPFIWLIKSKNVLQRYEIFDFPVNTTIARRKDGCVSFMLPVFNKARYLNRSIGSILDQNYECLEINLIDDGSTDNSNDIMKHWLKRDSRITLHTFEQNRGLVAARIEGVLMSYYDYVHPMDPDDELSKNCLNDFISYALQTNSDMVMGKVIAVTHNQRSEWDFRMVRENLNKTQLISRFYACDLNWNLVRLIKRNIILKAVQLLLEKFYVPVLNGEDKLFLGTILLFANNYSYYKEPVYIYYVTLPDNSRSGAYFKKKYSNDNSLHLVNAFLQTIHPNLKC